MYMPDDTDDLDQELADLIGDLQSDDSEDSVPTKHYSESEEPDDEQESAQPVVSQPVVNPPALVSSASISTPQPPSPVDDIVIDAKSHTNLDKLTGKYHSVFGELFENMRSDRDRIEEFINVYALNVQSEAPKQAFIEGLVQLLTTKAKISSDAVKMLDSLAKMLAASKSVVLGEKGVTAPKSELDRLMSSTTFDDKAP